MAPLPRWTLFSSAAAPVVLVGGWTVAAARQPGDFDPTRQTISALAALGATDRWLMSGALLGVGVCHLITASGLRAAAPAGRALLAAGGLATALVALFPLPRDGSGNSATAHGLSAAVAFGALAAWPLVAFRRGTDVGTLRPAVSVGAGLALLALLGWFALALATSSRVGLAERVAAGAQCCWPLVVAVDTHRGRRRAPRRPFRYPSRSEPESGPPSGPNRP